jgi:hypothetical protein
MLSFSGYLKENIQPIKHLTHLTHTEDNFLVNGEPGFHNAISSLNSVHDKLRGAFNTTKITTKYDGSPSVVFGRHPKTGSFFVATKSAFNVNPKINYSEEDIDRNHGHSPGLADKLKIALRHLPKVTPKSGIYQGDLMYTRDDIEKRAGKYHFTPNTITYSAPINSEHGKKIRTAQIGIVPHTKYHGHDLSSMTAGFDVDHENFAEHPHVHVITPTVQSVDHSEQNQKEFNTHIRNAVRHYHNSHPEMFDVVRSHRENLERYINHTVGEQSTPSVDGYRTFVNQRMQAEIEKKKTAKGKTQHYERLNAFNSNLDQNRTHFTQAFKMHNSIQKAKNALVNSLNASKEFGHHINGKPTEGEGFVVHHEGYPTKYVERHEFSRDNRLKNRKNK